MALYDKDKRFSTGWMVGGTVLMFVFHFFGRFVAVGAGITSLWVLTAIAAGCFALTGFVIGWRSEGQTIVEAGLAAAIATGLMVGIIGLTALAFLAPHILVIVLGGPFLAAVFGAWLGETLQGDTIETDDG
jgi:hypothetical protein